MPTVKMGWPNFDEIKMVTTFPISKMKVVDSDATLHLVIACTLLWPDDLAC